MNVFVFPDEAAKVWNVCGVNTGAILFQSSRLVLSVATFAQIDGAAGIQGTLTPFGKMGPEFRGASIGTTITGLVRFSSTKTKNLTGPFSRIEFVYPLVYVDVSDAEFGEDEDQEFIEFIRTIGKGGGR